MTTAAAVGRSLTHDSGQAGFESAAAAVASLDGRAPSVVLVFGTAAHDQQELLAGVQRAAGDAPLAGCSAEGVITQAGSDECSHAVGTMVVASDELCFRTYSATGFDRDAAGAARSLVQQIGLLAAGGGLLLVFPDGILGNCRELCDTLHALLPRGVVIAGGTAGDLLAFERTFQYHDGAVLSGGVSALFVGGAFEAELAVSHGCDLIGLPQTITRAEGGLVCEIDGSPAWEVFKSYLPDDAEDLEAMHVAHLLVAERIGDADPEGFGEFTVRVPVRLDKSTGALYFAAGLTTGTQVQLALRNPEKVCERAIAGARSVVARRPGQTPLLVLQLDCAGRGKLLFSDGPTEPLVDPVQAIFGKDVPWLGLHTYGEIAPVGGHTYFHNYTGVLCALYPKRARHG